MTKVTIYRENDSITGYCLDGHTGFALEGSDIVCSALSMLSITCANALERLAGAEIDCEQREGFLMVRLRPNQINEKTDLIFRLFELGARDIQAEYPANVKIIN